MRKICKNMEFVKQHNFSIGRQIFNLALDYLKYYLSIPMAIFMVFTVFMILATISLLILPHLAPKIEYLIKFFNIENSQFEFNLSSTKDFLKIYSEVSLILFLLGKLINYFTEFKINLNYRRKMVYSSIFILGSYIFFSFAVSLIGGFDSEFLIVSCIFAFCTLFFTFFSITANTLIDRLKELGTHGRI